MTFGFNRSQHLKSKIAIAELFSKGTHFSGYPVRILAVQKNVKSKTSNTQVLISVPKKKCKLAVQRNFVKRRIIESFRLNQHKLDEFTNEHQVSFNLGVIYTGEPEPSMADIEKGILKALAKLLKHFEKHIAKNEIIKE